MNKLFMLVVVLFGGMLVGDIASAQAINRKATLTWTAPTVCEGGATPVATRCPILGYSIQKQINNVWTQIGVTTAGVLTYTEENVALGSHSYRVLATSEAGPSPPSNIVTKSFDVPGAPGNLVITVTVTVTQ